MRSVCFNISDPMPQTQLHVGIVLRCLGRALQDTPPRSSWHAALGNEGSVRAKTGTHDQHRCSRAQPARHPCVVMHQNLGLVQEDLRLISKERWRPYVWVIAIHRGRGVLLNANRRVRPRFEGTARHAGRKQRRDPVRLPSTCVSSLARFAEPASIAERDISSPTSH